jgi:mannose-6-phosphate isomerase-like protein (cupin superfamily)
VTPPGTVLPLKKSFAEYRAFRIGPSETNRLAIVFDPVAEQTGFICCVEIFDVGGRTPPNVHQIAHEMFFVLKGEGLAHAGGVTVDIRTGTACSSRPGRPTSSRTPGRPASTR